ncbi:MAG: hypothetical protein AAFW46_15485, partial [Pseudomonadota bacterium]
VLGLPTLSFLLEKASKEPWNSRVGILTSFAPRKPHRSSLNQPRISLAEAFEFALSGGGAHMLERF